MFCTFLREGVGKKQPRKCWRVKYLLCYKTAWCFLWTNGQTNIVLLESKKQSLTTGLGTQELQGINWYLDRPFQGPVHAQKKNFQSSSKRWLRKEERPHSPILPLQPRVESEDLLSHSWENVTHNLMLCNNKQNSAAHSQSTYHNPRDGPKKGAFNISLKRTSITHAGTHNSTVWSVYCETHVRSEKRK